MLNLNYRQTVRDNPISFLICKGDSLGFCLRPIPYISDHWSSHTVNECPGGHFRIWRKNWPFWKNTKHLIMGIAPTVAIYEINGSGFFITAPGRTLLKEKNISLFSGIIWFCLYVRHTFKCKNVTCHRNVTDIQTR